MNLFIGLLGMAIDKENNEESFLRLRGEVCGLLLFYN